MISEQEEKTECSVQKPGLNHQEIQGEHLIMLGHNVFPLTSGKGRTKIKAPRQRLILTKKSTTPILKSNLFRTLVNRTKMCLVNRPL